jgi:hypothetical protein
MDVEFGVKGGTQIKDISKQNIGKNTWPKKEK